MDFFVDLALETGKTDKHVVQCSLCDGVVQLLTKGKANQSTNVGFNILS